MFDKDGNGFISAAEVGPVRATFLSSLALHYCCQGAARRAQKLFGKHKHASSIYVFAVEACHDQLGREIDR